MSFVKFMSSSAGRLVRIVAGLVLVVVGLLMGGGGGTALTVVGLVPLAAGVFDFCLFAPLAKLPLSGKAVRARTGQR